MRFHPFAGLGFAGAGWARRIGLLITAVCTLAIAGCAVAPRKIEDRPSGQYVAGPIGMTLGDLVPAQSLPARDEELWIIEKPRAANDGNDEGDAGPESTEVLAGGGTLLSVHGSALIPMPLEKTEVEGTINGAIASVDVRQRFTNSAKETADAIYTFPLPQNAAVNEFVLSIGRRHIRAILREKPEAEQIFREARGQGLLASLLVQKSPNVFSQRVANLEPGKGVDVEIRYFHAVEFRDGCFEFKFPMTVGLRGPGFPRKPTRDGKDISVAVHLNAGMAVEAVECPTHKATVKMQGAAADVSLIAADEIPNRDFRVRYRLAGEGIKPSLMTEKDGAGGTFALMLVPPARIEGIERKPLKVTLALLENAGRPGEQVAASLLKSLSAEDTFRIVHCRDQGLDEMAHPIEASAENVSRYADALEKSDFARLLDKYVAADSLGGVGYASGQRQADPHYSQVAFLINDGSAGPLSRLLAVPQSRWGNNRIFSVCVGTSAEPVLDEAVARRGGGAAVHFPAGGDANVMAKDLIDRISHPAISNLRLEWDGDVSQQIYPGQTREIYVGHSVLLTGRYEGQPPRSCRIFSGEKQVMEVHATRGAAVPGRSPIASIWARRKIAALGLAALSEPHAALGTEVKELALQYGLLSRYTAFVVVDATGQSPGEDNRGVSR